VTLRLADLQARPLFGLALVRGEASGAYASLLREVPVHPELVERLTLVMPPPNTGGLHEPVLIVRTRKPYDRGKLLEKLGPGAREVKIDGRTFRVEARGVGALYLAGPRTFARGTPEALALILAPARSAPLAGALAAAAGKHDVVAGVRPGALFAASLRSGGGGGGVKRGEGPSPKV